MFRTKHILFGYCIFFLATTIFLFSCSRYKSIVDYVKTDLFPRKVIHGLPTPDFEVPPKHSDKTYVQFLAMGDFGTGRKNQRIVAETMAKKAEQDPVQFVLTLGDNFYPHGVTSIRDEQWLTKFENIYDFPSLDVPFYAILGNHDHHGNINSEIEYTKISHRWRMPEAYYTFVYSLGEGTSIQFFALDTTPWANSEIQAILARPDSLKSRDQMTWLKNELQKSSAIWKIVMGHHPLYSSGKYGDNEPLIYLLEPLFVRYDVNLYLSGHDHDQELVKSIQGVHYIISGAASKPRNVAWRGITQYAAAGLGFTWFRVSDEELVVEFINRTGNLDYAYVIRRKKYKY